MKLRYDTTKWSFLKAKRSGPNTEPSGTHKGVEKHLKDVHLFYVAVPLICGMAVPT